jgi:hypothetical protein
MEMGGPLQKQTKQTTKKTKQTKTKGSGVNVVNGAKQMLKSTKNKKP